MVLLGPVNVKAESAICSFCTDQRIAGKLLDQAWEVGRDRLETLIPSQANLLRFYVEPSIFTRAGGSLFEYQCADLSDFGDSTVAITYPGELYFAPTRIVVERSLFENCPGIQSSPLMRGALTHEGFHGVASLQAQVSGSDAYGIKAIRKVASELLNAVNETAGISLSGISGVQAIASGQVSLSEELKGRAKAAESVFFNSLMHVTCEEVLAHFSSDGDLDEALRITLSDYWLDARAYGSYFYHSKWHTREFFVKTVGEEGNRCTPMLYDPNWYQRDKLTGSST